MSVKDFLVKIPFLCNADNAERWSRMIELVYDDELGNHSSVFARNEKDIEEPYNRMELAFAFRSDEADKVEYCRDLVELIFLSHYRIEKGESKHDDRIKNLVSVLEEAEPNYSEISATLTVSQAARGIWND